jgi:hypothetical protein
MTEILSFKPEDEGQPASLHIPYASTISRSPELPLIRIPQSLTRRTAVAGNRANGLFEESMADAGGLRLGPAARRQGHIGDKLGLDCPQRPRP